MRLTSILSKKSTDNERGNMDLIPISNLLNMLCLSAYRNLYEIFDVSFWEAESIIFTKVHKLCMCLILTSSLITVLCLPAYDDLHQEM
jgi:hypothetical protein